MARIPAVGGGLSSQRNKQPIGALPSSVVRNTQLSINVLDPAYGAVGNGVANDTSAVQAAINAAAALVPTGGLVEVVLPSGYTFSLAQLFIKSGVRIVAYGAKIVPITASLNQGLLYWSGTGSLNRFEVAGGTWIGAGTEGSGADLQMLFYVETSRGCDGVVLRDMRVDHWGTCAAYFRNAVRSRFLNNVLTDVGNAQVLTTAYNSVNFVADASFARQGQDLMVLGNTITNSGAAAISFTYSGQASVATEARIIVANNVCVGQASGTSLTGAINFEPDVNSPISNILVCNNHVHNLRASGASYGIAIGQSGTSNITQCVVDGNVVRIDRNGSGSNGIQTWANNDVVVTNNRVNAFAAGPPIAFSGTPYMSGNRLSSGAMTGRAVLVGGTVTVNTAEVQAAENISLTRVVTGGTAGHLSVGTIVAGTSFVINSSSGTDTSTVYWRIDH